VLFLCFLLGTSLQRSYIILDVLDKEMQKTRVTVCALCG
jgi:hypothetical protein